MPVDLMILLPCKTFGDLDKHTILSVGFGMMGKVQSD